MKNPLEVGEGTGLGSITQESLSSHTWTPHLVCMPSQVSSNAQHGWERLRAVDFSTLEKSVTLTLFMLWMQIIEMIDMEMKTCAFDD